MKKNCCYQCLDRKLLCHSTCNAYIEYTQERLELNRTISMQKKTSLGGFIYNNKIINKHFKYINR